MQVQPVKRDGLVGQVNSIAHVDITEPRIATTLAREVDGKLFLCTQKTGTPVRIPLPPHAATALAESPNDHPDYFSWNGKCLRESVVTIWERTLQNLFGKADVKEAHARRFRDTFAVELLLKGVPSEDLSVLLGYSSLKITGKHCRAPPTY